MNTRRSAQPNQRNRRWATLREAANYVGVHPKTLTRKFNDGTLIRYRMGGLIMVDLDELDDVLIASAGGLKTIRHGRSAGVGQLTAR